MVNKETKDLSAELLWPCPWSSILLNLLQLKRSDLLQFLKLKEDLLDFNMLPEEELLSVGGCVILLDKNQLEPSSNASEPSYQIGLVGAMREQPMPGSKCALKLLDGAVVPEAAVADIDLLSLPKGTRDAVLRAFVAQLRQSVHPLWFSYEQVLRSYQHIKLLRDLQPLVSRFEAAFNQQLLGGRLALGLHATEEDEEGEAGPHGGSPVERLKVQLQQKLASSRHLAEGAKRVLVEQLRCQQVLFGPSHADMTGAQGSENGHGSHGSSTSTAAGSAAATAATAAQSRRFSAQQAAQQAAPGKITILKRPQQPEQEAGEAAAAPSASAAAPQAAASGEAPAKGKGKGKKEAKGKAAADVAADPAASAIAAAAAASATHALAAQQAKAEAAGAKGRGKAKAGAAQDAAADAAAEAAAPAKGKRGQKDSAVKPKKGAAKPTTAAVTASDPETAAAAIAAAAASAAALAATGKFAEEASVAKPASSASTGPVDLEALLQDWEVPDKVREALLAAGRAKEELARRLLPPHLTQLGDLASRDSRLALLAVQQLASLEEGSLRQGADAVFRTLAKMGQFKLCSSEAAEQHMAAATAAAAEAAASAAAGAEEGGPTDATTAAPAAPQEIPEFLKLWGGEPAVKEALLLHFSSGALQPGDMDALHLVVLEELPAAKGLSLISSLVERRGSLHSVPSFFSSTLARAKQEVAARDRRGGGRGRESRRGRGRSTGRGEKAERGEQQEAPEGAAGAAASAAAAAAAAVEGTAAVDGTGS